MSFFKGREYIIFIYTYMQYVWEALLVPTVPNVLRLSLEPLDPHGFPVLVCQPLQTVIFLFDINFPLFPLQLQHICLIQLMDPPILPLILHSSEPRQPVGPQHDHPTERYSKEQKWILLDQGLIPPSKTSFKCSLLLGRPEHFIAKPH